MAFSLAILADDIPTAPLTLIERYGSFGLICVIVAGLVFYVFPKAMAYFSEQHRLFTEELRAERKSREESHAKCEEGHRKAIEAQEKHTAALDAVCDRLERVENEVRKHES